VLKHLPRFIHHFVIHDHKLSGFNLHPRSPFSFGSSR
jgi:hypothetical protein